MNQDRNEKNGGGPPSQSTTVIPDPARLRGWAPHLSEQQFAACEIYLAELLKFNSKLNLISSGTARRADAAHILDVVRTWTLVEPRVPKGSEVFDFGSGNGLPGLLCAALSPEISFQLVDRDQRKIEFCKHLGSVLKLTNVGFQRIDARSIAPNSVKFAISRGFAAVTPSLLLARPLFATGGVFFMMKGESWSSELADVPPALFSVWSSEMIGQYRLPESPAEFVVLQSTKISD